MLGTSAVKLEKLDALDRALFSKAKPFPHIVIDDFLTVDPDVLLAEFPGPDWDGWEVYQDPYQRGKRICSDITRMPPALSRIIIELSEPPALQALEKLTGVAGLLPDPYLNGGGLHCSQPGGILAPHTDFHHYSKLSLYRQLNLLIYLNPEWSEADGGCLELYREGERVPAKTVVPTFGRTVLFRTDDHSVHGFSTPVAERSASSSPWRRSIALYYYTSTESNIFGGDTSTYWRTHAEHSGAAKARFYAYRGLLFTSRAFSHLAHRANPDLGSRVRPVRKTDAG